ncbi:MAG: radical SAM protein, partial [Clostridium sp.]
INDNTARNFNRGYDLEVFDKSIKELQKRGIEVVVHTIFGLPGETKEDMLKTVDYVAHSGSQGVKFHLLHLMKGTKMVEQYESGELKLLSKEDYIDLICKGIAMIPEEMVVHRLTGDAPRASLIGPMWSLKKWEVLNDIDKALVDNDICREKF